MKNTIKVPGFIALAVVIGVIAACSGAGAGGGGTTNGGTINGDTTVAVAGVSFDLEKTNRTLRTDKSYAQYNN
jgi:hypothetical protein